MGQGLSNSNIFTGEQCSVVQHFHRWEVCCVCSVYAGGQCAVGVASTQVDSVLSVHHLHRQIMCCVSSTPAGSVWFVQHLHRWTVHCLQHLCRWTRCYVPHLHWWIVCYLCSIYAGGQCAVFNVYTMDSVLFAGILLLSNHEISLLPLGVHLFFFLPL